MNLLLVVICTTPESLSKLAERHFRHDSYWCADRQGFESLQFSLKEKQMLLSR